MLGGHRTADQLVNKGFPFRAAVVCTDLNALGMQERLLELGYRVPEDFALIGFDNSITTRFSKPGLPSIDQNIMSLGYGAVELLYQQFEHIPIIQHEVIVKSSLIIQGSCGCEEGIKQETITKENSQNALILKNTLNMKWELIMV